MKELLMKNRTEIFSKQLRIPFNIRFVLSAVSLLWNANRLRGTFENEISCSLELSSGDLTDISNGQVFVNE